MMNLFTIETEEKSDPLLDFWNGLPNVRHHKKPSAARARGLRLLMSLRHGELPVSPLWAERVGVPADWLHATWTDAELRQMLRTIDKVNSPTFMPEDKTGTPRSLENAVYTDSTMGCPLLYYRARPPRRLDFSLSESQSREARRLADTLFDGSVAAVAGVILDVWEWTPPEHESPVARDTLGYPASACRFYADWVASRYSTFAELRPEMLRVGGKIWMRFLAELPELLPLSKRNR